MATDNLIAKIVHDTENGKVTYIPLRSVDYWEVTNGDGEITVTVYTRGGQQVILFGDPATDFLSKVDEYATTRWPY
jgi:hypothetical protein